MGTRHETNSSAGSLASALMGLGESDASRRAVLRDPGGAWRTGEWLASSAGQFAEEAVRAGVRAGDRVVLVARADARLAAHLAGLWLVGAVAVPVSPSAPDLQRERVIHDCGATWVLGIDGRLAPTGLVGPDSAGESGHARLLIYTSGTTGRPKGVVHTDESLLAAASSVRAAWQITPQDRLVHALPLSHIHGLVVGLLTALVSGASVDMLARFETSGVVESIETQGASLFFGVPTMYYRLARDGGARSLARLRLAVSGSAPLAPSLFGDLTAAGVPLLERYGMTETGLVLSQALHGPRRPGTVGSPMPGVRVGVHEGELHVASPAMCAGFWGQPGRLEEQMREGYFATGDLVEVEDGVYRVLGRRSNLIISGGFNVVPEAVETELLEHPSIHEVAVVGVPDEEFGELVTAFVVADSDFEESAVRDWLAEHLAPAQRPRRYVRVAQLPRNEMGKLLRAQLRSE